MRFFFSSPSPPLPGAYLRKKCWLCVPGVCSCPPLVPDAPTCPYATVLCPHRTHTEPFPRVPFVGSRLQRGSPYSAMRALRSSPSAWGCLVVLNPSSAPSPLLTLPPRRSIPSAYPLATSGVPRLLPLGLDKIQNPDRTVKHLTNAIRAINGEVWCPRLGEPSPVSVSQHRAT